MIAWGKFRQIYQTLWRSLGGTFLSFFFLAWPEALKCILKKKTYIYKIVIQIQFFAQKVHGSCALHL